MLRPALERAGIKAEPYVHGFHLFRHSAATLLEELTSGLRAGQKLLGHTSASTTADYTHQRGPVESGRMLAEQLANRGLLVAGEGGAVQ